MSLECCPQFSEFPLWELRRLFRAHRPSLWFNILCLCSAESQEDLKSWPLLPPSSTLPHPGSWVLDQRLSQEQERWHALRIVWNWVPKGVSCFCLGLLMLWSPPLLGRGFLFRAFRTSSLMFRNVYPCLDLEKYESLKGVNWLTYRCSHSLPSTGSPHFLHSKESLVFARPIPRLLWWATERIKEISQTEKVVPDRKKLGGEKPAEVILQSVTKDGLFIHFFVHQLSIEHLLYVRHSSGAEDRAVNKSIRVPSSSSRSSWWTQSINKQTSTND